VDLNLFGLQLGDRTNSPSELLKELFWFKLLGLISFFSDKISTVSIILTIFFPVHNFLLLRELEGKRFRAGELWLIIFPINTKESVLNRLFRLLSQ
jgi:hypothetical protein